MKKPLFLAAILFLLGGGAYYFLAGNTSAGKDTGTNGIPESVTGIQEKEQEQPGSGKQPKRLHIPKLGISAAVEYVGMDEKGRMDVPKNDDNVAWYELGYTPGTRGNAVMAGHLDRRSGAPAVFYNLEDLEVGDSIRVEAADGTEMAFTVTGKETYPDAAFPLVEVFGPSDTVRLNLITCEGSYNQSNRSYSHRTVVYSELEE
jgi:sortase A